MPWICFFFIVASLAWADAPPQWAPPSGTQPAIGATPPPSSLSKITANSNKKLFVIGKTLSMPPPSSLSKTPSSTLPEFHSENPYEVLSEAWKVRLLCKEGEIMDDFRPLPSAPSAIACFSGPQEGILTLICSHAIGKSPADSQAQEGVVLPVSQDLVFDPQMGGGCTRILITEKDAKVLRKESALLGTQMNSSGCATPWGTFLTGENIQGKSSGSHGCIFEVKPIQKGLGAPLPVKLGGPISIGALYADKNTHDVYIGEACPGGLLYRMRADITGQLERGVRLWVLGFGKTSGSLESGGSLSDKSIHWIALPSSMADPHETALRMGGAPLGEISGIGGYEGALYITLRSGGADRAGCILRIASGKVTIFDEARAAGGIKNPGAIFINDKAEVLVCQKCEKGSRLLLKCPGLDWKALLWVKRGPIGGVAVSPDSRAIFVTLSSSGSTLVLWRNE
jgi:hypothetical protein